MKISAGIASIMRRRKLLVGLAVAILLLAAWTIYEFSRMGPGIPPAAKAGAIDTTHQILQPARTQDAERGRVLALAGNCFSCHTADKGKPFAGGVPFYTDFGTIYSTNISSDPKTGIGKWTEAEFVRAMREGIGRDGEHLYPAFPYTSFTQLSDRDVRSLYAFIRTLNPVAYVPPENEMKFPLNFRLSLLGWKQLYFRPGRFRAKSGQTAEQKRGDYLVSALAHCSACHTPRNTLGAEKEDLAFAGGTFYDHVRTGDVRSWGSPNLTQHSSGLKSWSRQDIEEYLTQGTSSKAFLMGPMNEVVLNSTRHLPESDIRSIAAYLKALPPRSYDRPKAVDKDRFKAGELSYIANCGSCHGLGGKGDRQTAPSLAGSPMAQAPDPASLINIILYGPDISPGLETSVSRPDMPSFDAKLDDQEIADLTTYLRASFGNRASPVSAKQVQKQR
ncbi:c-type cytochrome [Sphingopyxis sp. USTB-05]|uniref:c-type cytochrome n=1 Tax=Sphingopyxis sp. USTB-05 TaxID=2830667 RepID=UPI002078E444|nr:c-type cytochrome [Sphingopyxis sp. USTB-05]USI77616.1 c-type cytochrome [Sphingopyxis sp. USTB-05]